jgi:hypothetical protein
MNVRRGLWRTWIFLTALWVIGTVTLAYFVLPESVASRKYQYVYNMRSDVPDPNKVDWTKDFYSLMQSPSKEKLASTFDIQTYQYATTWDEDVKKGMLITVEFPDKSHLYMSAQMTQVDRDYVAKAFWNQRWERWGIETLPWVAGAIVPPIILLLLGSFMVWVGRGFTRD